MTSFLIIDDHPLFREALGNAVRLALPEAQILEAMSINDALHILASEQGIDLALLDLSLPDATGFSGFLRLRETHPRLPVAIVSSEEDQHVVREVSCLVPPVICRNRHRSGAGVVDRGRPQRFVSVPRISAAATGRRSPDNTQALQAKLRTPHQQLRVLDLLAQGLPKPANRPRTATRRVDGQSAHHRDPAEARPVQPQQGGH